MTYDPIDPDADGAYDTNELTVNTLNGLDLSANVGAPLRVDGDTVFTAETLPVAYSNLIAWYPFDSAEYGGSNADDVTALFNPGQSGDSTAYDGTVQNATFQASGGVTDINAGANSGAFDFPGGDQNNPTYIEIQPVFNTSEFTFTCWAEVDDTSRTNLTGMYDPVGFRDFFYGLDVSNGELLGFARYGSSSRDHAYQTSNGNISSNQYVHIAVVFYDSSSTDWKFYLNGTQLNSSKTNAENAGSVSFDASNEWYIGWSLPNSDNPFDGRLDDVRYYNRELNQSEINQIYQNTEP